MSERRSVFETVLRDCLVGVVTGDSDLGRFRDERWYRIPDRALGRSLGRNALEDLRTVALYQTGGITDGLPGAIELWGEIVGIETARRREIVPDEPGHPAADELYHRISVADVRRLEQPILSRLPRRITFLRTTRERLLLASDINDLIVGSPTEERLWKELRKQDLEVGRKVFMQVDGVVMEVDFGLIFDERGLAVFCGEEEGIAEPDRLNAPEAWHVIRFSPSRIERELENCLVEIFRAAEEMRRNRE